MAARRDKPALFELVKKGPIKPDTQGALRTPRWFYGQAESPQTQVPPGQPEAPLPPPAKKHAAVSQRLEQVIEHLHQHRSTTSAADAPTGRTAKESRRLTIVAPWWAAILAVLAFCLILLVAFQMGQTNGYRKAKMQASMALPLNPAKDSTRTGDPLEGVRNSDVRSDMVPPAPKTVNRLDSPKQTDANPAKTDIAAAANAVQPIGNCLIVCGHKSWRELRDVQEFFTKNGIPTQIGRLGENYVLFSEASYENPNQNEQAGLLKEKVAQLGKNYNSEKPANAARFNPETFAGAYWAKMENISPID